MASDDESARLNQPQDSRLEIVAGALPIGRPFSSTKPYNTQVLNRSVGGDEEPTHIVRTIWRHTNVTHRTDETRLDEDFRWWKRDANTADGTLETVVTINEVASVGAPGTPLRKEKIRRSKTTRSTTHQVMFTGRRSGHSRLDGLKGLACGANTRNRQAREWNNGSSRTSALLGRLFGAWHVGAESEKRVERKGSNKPDIM